MSFFDELLREKMKDDQSSASRPVPEAIIMELKERASRYAAPNPYKAGDLVTPRKGGSMRGAGQPHLVVETFEPVRTAIEKGGSNGNYERIDMRVMCFMEDSYATFPAASWVMEPYTGEGAKG